VPHKALDTGPERRPDALTYIVEVRQPAVLAGGSAVIREDDGFIGEGVREGTCE
jgi:hypothetical protein